MKKLRAVCTAITIVAVVLTVPLSFAADWPGWLGPDQDGSSPETGIFGKGETTLTVAWSRELGVAYSGIAVVKGKAITMYGDGENDWLVALSTGDGSEIWRYRIGEMFPKVGGADGGQLSMPVVHDGTVYGLGAAGRLFAVRLENGGEIWSTDVVAKHGGKQPYFGFTTTPIVANDVLFVQTGGSDGHSLTGFDRATGKARWAVGDEKVGYQSPVVTSLAGRRQIVAVTNTSVRGLDPAKGTELWSTEHGLVSQRDGWSTPISIGEDRFVLTGGAESAAFEVSKSGGAFSVSEVWRDDTLKGNFAMPVVHDGHLYGYNGDFLSCVAAATGKLVWKDRTDAAGLILVDDHLVLFASDGQVVVAPATPAGFEASGRVKVSDKAGFTYPSFSDGGIFVRDLKSIARVNVGS